MSEEPPPEETEIVEPPWPVDSVYVPPPPESPYIMTLEQLVATQEALVTKESTDRALVATFVNPDPGMVRTRLLQWASIGFPNIFVLLSVDLSPPSVCLDGVARSRFEYIHYLTTTSLSDHVRALEEKLPGMSLSYSTPGNMIQIHVSKV
jgi:hypothetical protein